MVPPESEDLDFDMAAVQIGLRLCPTVANLDTTHGTKDLDPKRVSSVDQWEDISNLSIRKPA